MLNEGYISGDMSLGVISVSVTICTGCSVSSTFVSNVAWFWIVSNWLLNGKCALNSNYMYLMGDRIGNWTTHKLQHWECRTEKVITECICICLQEFVSDHTARCQIPNGTWSGVIGSRKLSTSLSMKSSKSSFATADSSRCQSFCLMCIMCCFW